MIAEVINTGSELLLGKVINTHLAFFGNQLFELGIRIERQLAVPDGDAIQRALEESFARRPDVVFVTGGLGPTTDDITRDLLAEMLGVGLVLDPVIWRSIEERFAKRNLKLSDRIHLQAMVPVGVEPILNDWGTAPGLFLPASAKNPPTFFLPGPPRELKPMFTERIIPILQQLFPGRSDTVCSVYRITGMGESMVEEKIGTQLLAIPNLELGYCARSGEVDVRVLGNREAVDAANSIIETALSDRIYARGDGTMEETVIHLLQAHKKSIATAESCTGGMLGNALTNVPGASEVFLAGWITYSNQIKATALEIDARLIEEFGAVSEPVAEAMASHARRIGQTDFALSTTGIAGPGGGTPDKPVGTVFIGLASARGVSVTKHYFPTDRQTFKQLVSQAALNRLRESLISQPG